MESHCTANLKDSGAFAQISLAIATYYDSRVLENIKQHEIAVRSAVLMRLAAQDEAELSTPEGKERLQAELKKAVNEVLIEKTGFGGVDHVFFTNLFIQCTGAGHSTQWTIHLWTTSTHLSSDTRNHTPPTCSYH